jgi:quercetin dioxygenase-like cupin family protein
MSIRLSTLAAATAMLLAAGMAQAQAPGLTRTIVTKADVAQANHEAIIARVEVAAGAVAGWHTHPGDEISYVEQGEAILLIAGQGPRKFSRGDGFVIPAGTVHSARNDGTSQIKLVSVYVVEKGKPLASPAAEPK